MISDKEKHLIKEHTNSLYLKKAELLNRKADESIEDIRINCLKKGRYHSGIYISQISLIHYECIKEKLNYKKELLKEAIIRKEGVITSKDIDWMIEDVAQTLKEEITRYRNMINVAMQKSDQGNMIQDQERRLVEEEDRLREEIRSEAEIAKNELSAFGNILSTTNIQEHKTSAYPHEIESSIEKLKRDHPDPSKTAFIIMRFGDTDRHNRIMNAIKDILSKHGIKGIRADEKEYHEDLFNNILTYIYGCGFGIAVFEKIESNEYNPNVSLEVGYMMGLKKPVCLLKDKSLEKLPTDLIGKLYKEFNSVDTDTTIANVLENWLKDKGYVNNDTDAVILP